MPHASDHAAAISASDAHATGDSGSAQAAKHVSSDRESGSEVAAKSETPGSVAAKNAAVSAALPPRDRHSASDGHRGSVAGQSDDTAKERPKREHDARDVKVCVACSKSAADVNIKRLLLCSVCTVAPAYCSVECQRACLPAHNAECKANRRAAVTVKAPAVREKPWWEEID